MPTPKHLLITLAAASAALFSLSATAGPYADTLSKCLVQSTTPGDKHALVRWVFATVALQPDVQSMASISAEQRDEINKTTAQLLERLLTVACRKEAQQALQFEGLSTLGSSFQALGQVAGRDLFADPSVASGLAASLKYVDMNKLLQLALQVQ